MLHSLIPKTQRPCVKCGGYFRPDKLSPVFRVMVRYLSDTGRIGLPFGETVAYCERCEPPTPLVFILYEEGLEENADERYFHVRDGFFQDVDETTGEDRHLISLDEYAHAFCTECGELIEETECQRHRSSVNPEPGPDAGKRKRSR